MASILVGFSNVFRSRRYLFLTGIVTIVFFIIETWLANLAAVKFALTSPLLSLANRIAMLTTSVAVFVDVLPLTSQLIAGVLAILVGIHVSLVMYYFKTRSFATTAAGTSLVGVGLSILGAGCVSCGPVILSSFLGFAASIRVLTLLPFHGKEFGLVAVAIMLGSILVVLRKIASPHMCSINRRGTR